MTEGHVAATCCIHKIMCCSDIGDAFCARNVTLSLLIVSWLQDSATCHLRVKTRDFVAAACHWDMSLRHDPSCARTLRLLPLQNLHFQIECEYINHTNILIESQGIVRLTYPYYLKRSCL